MIYLLYGPDTVRSREKLNEIISEYRKKSGDGINFYTFDAEEDDSGEMKRVLAAASLFSSKKIVVLKYLTLSPNKEVLLDELKKIKDSRDTIVFLWERELGEKIVSELRPYCSKTQEFKSGEKLEKPGVTIFELGDTFFISPREGLRALLGLFHAGHDDFNLFSYLVNHARMLLTVKHYIDKGEGVASSHGIHPFVIKKASATVRKLSPEKLESSMRSFLEEDFKIKTGASGPRDSLTFLLTNKLR